MGVAAPRSVGPIPTTAKINTLTPASRKFEEIFLVSIASLNLSGTLWFQWLVNHCWAVALFSKYLATDNSGIINSLETQVDQAEIV
jgi:hypothetical protein